MINNATTATLDLDRQVNTFAEYVRVGDRLRRYGIVNHIHVRGDERVFETNAAVIGFVIDEHVTVYRAR